MKSPEWFKRWFGDEYKRLYPHRDGAQAAAQTAALLAAVRSLRTPDSAPPLSLLDIGCGAGRHLASLDGRDDVRAVGVDLSPVLLRDARSRDLNVARADMRRLPFADDRFDVVASFFTSFGYFATADEDAATLLEFTRVVKPGGFLFLDLPHKAVVIRDLVPTESSAAPGRRVEVTRALEGDVVVKRIVIMSDNGETEYHEERVRLYELPNLEPVFARVGLHVVKMFGDERGAEFVPGTSPRMSLLLRREGPSFPGVAHVSGGTAVSAAGGAR